MKLYISKLDAAKRQLEMALNLFFRNGDPVSIHTLVNASQQILQDICNTQGVQGIKVRIMDMVREDKKKEFLIKINAPRNFFKHADKDPDGIIDFNSEMTYLDLWDACMMYTTLTQETPAIMQVFYIWNYANSPDIIILSDAERKMADLAIATSNLDPKNRNGFLQLVPFIEGQMFDIK